MKKIKIFFGIIAILAALFYLKVTIYRNRDINPEAIVMIRKIQLDSFDYNIERYVDQEKLRITKEVEEISKREEFMDFPQVVADQKGSQAKFPVHGQDVVLKFGADPGIKGGEGLIEQQDAGPYSQGPGQGDPLLFTAAQVARQPVQQAFEIQQGNAMTGEVVEQFRRVLDDLARAVRVGDEISWVRAMEKANSRIAQDRNG